MERERETPREAPRERPREREPARAPLRSKSMTPRLSDLLSSVWQPYFLYAVYSSLDGSFPSSHVQHIAEPCQCGALQTHSFQVTKGNITVMQILGEWLTSLWFMMGAVVGQMGGIISRVCLCVFVCICVRRWPRWEAIWSICWLSWDADLVMTSLMFSSYFHHFNMFFDFRRS